MSIPDDFTLRLCKSATPFTHNNLPLQREETAIFYMLFAFRFADVMVLV